MSTKLAILGAGHGGQGLAAYLALAGHEVHLYNRSKSRLLPIQSKMGFVLRELLMGLLDWPVVPLTFGKCSPM